MHYDLFISYSREDDKNNRITEFKERIEAEYFDFANEKLKCFFDIHEINIMDDWREHISQGLKDSDLLLVFLSPNFIDSFYCNYEIIEYLKYEYSRGTQGEGIAQIYFLEIPDLSISGFKEKTNGWIENLNRRQRFDFRPWYEEGSDSLKRKEVKTRLDELKKSLQVRLSRMRRYADSIGNIPAPNSRFIGRQNEMKVLHESVGLGRLGEITVIQGICGLGKTTIAIQYAFSYADFFPGGRWYISCENETRLASVLRKLEVELKMNFSEDEKKDDTRCAKRVLNELEALANKKAVESSTGSSVYKPLVLLILDNVNQPVLLQPPNLDLVSGKEWLRIIAITKKSEVEIGSDHTRYTYLPIDVLSSEDAFSLLLNFRPAEMNLTVNEEHCARLIVDMLGSFTLAVELTGLYLYQRKGQVSYADFLKLLQTKGIAKGIEDAGTKTNIALSHSKKLSLTLSSTLEILSTPELSVLGYASCLLPEAIPLPWIKPLIVAEYPDFGISAGIGEDDPWISMINHLISLRLLKVVDFEKSLPRVVRIDQLVHNYIRDLNSTTDDHQKRELKIEKILSERSFYIHANVVNQKNAWELECLYKIFKTRLNDKVYIMKTSAMRCCGALREYGRYEHALEIAYLLIDKVKTGLSSVDVSLVWCYNMAGVAALSLDDFTTAEKHFIKAKEISEKQGKNSMDYLDSLTNLGCLYRETLKPVLALKPSKEALKISNKKFGTDSPETAVRYVNLGLVFQDLNNLQDAVPLFRKATDIYASVPDLALNYCENLSTLSFALRNDNKPDEAYTLANKAFNLINTSNFGDHEVKASVFNNLAGILEDKGQFLKARELYHSALEVSVLCQGESSTHKSLYLNNLGINSLFLHQYHSAIHELEESLTAELGKKSVLHQKVAHRKLNIGIANLFTGNYTNSKFFLNSAWEDKITTGNHDLLSARILLARLALSFLTDEDSLQIAIQIRKIVTEAILISPGINIKWPLEGPIGTLISELKPEHSEQWNTCCNLINYKSKKYTTRKNY